MTNFLLVALGGAIGAAARYAVTTASFRAFGPGFPYGTLIVNVLGCFAMGLLIEWLARKMPGSHDIRLFLTTGVLGGFTTFSAFSLDFASLWERGDTLTAFGYTLASVALSVMAIFLGLAAMRSLA
ncbi:MAG: fluoride efflux transporter CrcB [Hyphomicrobiales bacterium]|nr:fluoride efflux transporter CrcB [Hyphomicrobiales bacterium]